MGRELSRAEIRVLRKITEGKTNPEVAAELCVSVNTVKTQTRSILSKLEVGDRAAAALHCVRYVWTDQEREKWRLSERHRRFKLAVDSLSPTLKIAFAELVRKPNHSYFEVAAAAKLSGKYFSNSVGRLVQESDIKDWDDALNSRVLVVIAWELAFGRSAA